MNEKIKLFITDDHKIVIDGISSFLLGNEKYGLLGFAQNANQLFESLQNEQPHILLLDIRLQGLSGIQIAPMVKRQYPNIKIIALSSDIDAETIDEAIKAGCSGYLSKDIEEEEFFYALSVVLNGENYYSRGIQQTIFNNYTQKATNEQLTTNENLSEREVEIIQLFTDGLSYAEIADKLCISKRTVETHKKNIMQKLELKTTVDLVKYAMINGIAKI
jgi:DNA-binding NarL/FixJ family response regulator